MADDARNDANLRHFTSRSKQPKNTVMSQPTPLNVFISLEQNLDQPLDPVMDSYGRRYGVSPQISTYSASAARRSQFNCTRDGFIW